VLVPPPPPPRFSVKRCEQVEHLVDDLGDARVGGDPLVDGDDPVQAKLQRLCRPRIGQAASDLRRLHEDDNAIDNGEDTLTSAAEVGVAWVSTM